MAVLIGKEYVMTRQSTYNAGIYVRLSQEDMRGRWLFGNKFR